MLSIVGLAATVGRAASEEAVFNAASRSAETLRLGAESGAKELRRLRDQVQAGEVEMLRGQQKLRQAASRLRALVRPLPRRTHFQISPKVTDDRLPFFPPND